MQEEDESLTEGIDFSTPMGELMFAQLGAFAQFEAAMMAKRTAAGRLGGNIQVGPRRDLHLWGLRVDCQMPMPYGRHSACQELRVASSAI
jgi:hypothetical protein